MITPKGVRMFRVVLVFWFACLLAQPVYAGAWLREKGKGFLAYSNLTASTLDTSYSACFDYGLNRKMTIGATLEVLSPLNRQLSGQGLVFMRRSLNWSKSNAHWAYELGVGARHTGIEFVPIAKTSLSYGRGVSWGKRDGWFAVDAGVEWDLGYSKHVVKIDSTLGLEFGERSKGMLQVFNTFGEDWTNITVSPSYVYKTKKKKINYVFGLENSSLTPDIVAIKIGVWQSF